MRAGAGNGSGARPRAGETEAVRSGVEILRALGHPVRFRIIELLMDGELCVKRLEELLGVSQSSVSQHLSRLRYAGLIESERRGHLVCYRLADDRAVDVLHATLAKEGARPRRAEEKEGDDG